MARKTTKRAKSPSQPKETPQTRRSVLVKGAAYAAGGLVLAGGAGAFAMDFRKKLAEQDLSVIGQGTPVIVQIHDPQCQLCTTLQRHTRRALRSIEDGAVLYRVANIKTEEGSAHQAREGLPHVTLVLYNGDGERVHVIEGVTPTEELIEAFQNHLRLPLA